MLKVSVILIVCNRVELLKKSLLSLNNQSVLPDEVIVTDDGSVEDVISVLHEISEKTNYKLKYVRQSNRGFRAAKARNNGVRASENDFLIFLDQDIIATKNYIKTFVENSDENRFIVSYPIRLTEAQSKLMDENTFRGNSYKTIITFNQRFKILRQYLSDYRLYLMKRSGLRKKGPKLRSGVFAIHKKNYLKVNGFDEKYIGWGNEDDDLHNRLNAINVFGFNPFWNEYPLHLYHEPHHVNGERVNKSYYQNQKDAAKSGLFRCEFGYDNPLGDDEIKVIELSAGRN